MNKTYLTGALIASLMFNAVLVYRLTHLPTPEPASAPDATAPSTTKNYESGASHPFIRVVDGDTVMVGIEGKSEYVRLIGIDSPEPNDPGGPECYAQEATEHLKEIARTGTVVLHYDATQTQRDSYGRLLAYVELTDGTDLGETMIRDGYAREYTYGEPYERREAYVAAEQEAIAQETGLWSPDTCPAQ